MPAGVWVTRNIGRTYGRSQGSGFDEALLLSGTAFDEREGTDFQVAVTPPRAVEARGILHSSKTAKALFCSKQPDNTKLRAPRSPGSGIARPASSRYASETDLCPIPRRETPSRKFVSLFEVRLEADPRHSPSRRAATPARDLKTGPLFQRHIGHTSVRALRARFRPIFRLPEVSGCNACPPRPKCCGELSTRHTKESSPYAGMPVSVARHRCGQHPVERPHWSQCRRHPKPRATDRRPGTTWHFSAGTSTPPRARCRGAPSARAARRPRHRLVMMFSWAACGSLPQR